jgi:hypothetical protein
MKKTVPFELFGENQYLMFDIIRLGELEKLLGVSMIRMAAELDAGVNFCIYGLMIGMKQHYKPDPRFYAKKIEEHLDNGGNLLDIAKPILEAINKTNVFNYAVGSGEDEYAEDEEVKNEEELAETPKPKKKPLAPSKSGSDGPSQ